MCGVITPFPQHAFMAWHSVKAQGQLYLSVADNVSGHKFLMSRCSRQPVCILYLHLRRTVWGNDDVINNGDIKVAFYSEDKVRREIYRNDKSTGKVVRIGTSVRPL
jgi:hypothetical protein